MKGILRAWEALEAEGTTDQRWMHWSEVLERRTAEAAWARAWPAVRQVQPVATLQPWPGELARDWLGLEWPLPPPSLPENVRALLEAAAPLLAEAHR